MQYTETLNPGMAVVRATRAKLLEDAGLSGERAVTYAERTWGVGSRPAMIARAMVTPAATYDPAAISEPALLGGEFVQAVRPMTVLGKLQGIRRVPLNVKFARATAGAMVAWVGERSVTPLSSMSLDMVELPALKIAGIVPVSSELLKLSDPSAEALLRDDLLAAVASLSDVSFLDPTRAGEANVSPASVTYGATSIASSGSTAAAARADIRALVQLIADQGVDFIAPAIIVDTRTAIALASMDGDFFSQVTVKGGMIAGIPLIVSSNAPRDGNSPSDSVIVLVDAAHINLADPGAVEFDTARHASLQMETTPDSPPTAATVPLNLWQHNLIAIKAVRYINWTLRRPEAVAYLTGVRYTG